MQETTHSDPCPHEFEFKYESASGIQYYECQYCKASKIRYMSWHGMYKIIKGEKK